MTFVKQKIEEFSKTLDKLKPESEEHNSKIKQIFDYIEQIEDRMEE